MNLVLWRTEFIKQFSTVSRKQKNTFESKTSTIYVDLLYFHNFVLDGTSFSYKICVCSILKVLEKF